jgi:hypothetical protein
MAGHAATSHDDDRQEGRIARSWRLSRVAWTVVRSDRAILILAIMSTVVGAAGLAVIYDLSGAFSGHRHTASGRLALASLILAYPLTFMSVFFNTAIAAAASAVLQGGRLSLREALAVPVRRIGQVAVWSFLVSVVGVLIEQIASRLPFIGSLAVRLAGLSWSLASMFAIPILATEGCSAPACLSRSAALVKKRWGEGISGNVIITAWTVVVILPVAFLFGIGFAASRGQAGTRVGLLAAFVIIVVAIGAAGAVIRQTFGVVLYRYAVSGAAAGGFDTSDLEAPFSSGGPLSPRSKAMQPMWPSSGISRRLWLVSALLGAAVTLAVELSRHHFAARHLTGRVMAGVTLWVAFTLIARGVAFAVEKTSASDRTSRLLWLGSAVMGAVLTLTYELSRHHFAAHRIAGRIVAGVLIFILASFVIRGIASALRAIVSRI